MAEVICTFLKLTVTILNKPLRHKCEAGIVKRTIFATNTPNLPVTVCEASIGTVSVIGV